MSQPAKQDLINEIEALPADYYGEVLNFVHFLRLKKNQLEAENQNPLLQYSGQLADTDLMEPEDTLPHLFGP